MRWLIITVLVLLWAATFTLGLGIAFGIEPGFDAESAIKSIGTLSTGLTAAVSYFGIQLRSTRRELEEERFSTPMALAYGYARNFLEPAANPLSSTDREALGKEYIQRFRDYLLECAGKLRLEGNIELTDARLAFLNGPGDGQSATS